MKSLTGFLEKKIINIASKDFTEMIIYKEYSKNKNGIILINQHLTQERIIKNLKFLAPKAKVLFLSNPFEIYKFTSVNVFEVAKEIENINLLLTQKFDFIILDYKLLNLKIPSRNFFLNKTEVKQGESFGHSKLVNLLFELGYNRCETVFEFGEFAVRGFIIDIGTLHGFYRIEFDGEVIVSIGQFNTETQRKNLDGGVPMLHLLNIKEIVLTEQTLEKAKNRANLFEIEPSIVNDLRGFYAFSLFNFLPLFFEETSNILQFLPKDYSLFYYTNLEETLQMQRQNLENLYSLYKNEGRILLTPTDLFYQ